MATYRVTAKIACNTLNGIPYILLEDDVIQVKYEDSLFLFIRFYNRMLMVNKDELKKLKEFPARIYHD